MGRNIGRLGRAREPWDLSFTYFDDAVIRVHPDASDTVELDFLQIGQGMDLAALEGVDLSTVEATDDTPEAVRKALGDLAMATQDATVLVLTSLQEMIHPEDWPTYWRLSRENRQMMVDLMADLKRISAALVRESTGFPTTPLSDSPRGQASAAVKSEGGSSLGERFPVPEEIRQGLELNRGRPDLQEFYVIRLEALRDKATAEAAERARMAGIS